MNPAEKILVRMRGTKHGWGYEDLKHLYLGFGFEIDEGGKHALFIHPKYPQLRATVGRHRSLAVGYVQYAIRTIDELQKLEVN